MVDSIKGLQMPLSGLPVTVRVDGRARRLRLRVHPRDPLLRLTVPPGVAKRLIVDFLKRHEDWVRAQLSRLPAHTPFAEGTKIPLRGQPHEIRLTGKLRGLPSLQDGVVWMPGAADHLARRMHDFLRYEARRDVTAAVEEKAGAAGLSFHGITLRDPRSRWGSCSPSGRLSFSWRLIMSPAHVLDYVVAHEVAHLRHMHHGKAFWALCHRLAEAPRAAQDWLKQNGASLHRYG